MVNRQFHNFLKTHQATLVHAACHPQDPLSYLLVLQSEPFYHTFFALRREKAISRSLDAKIMRDKEYAKQFDGRKDPAFYKSVGARRILRAGFLLHHRIVSAAGRTAKEAFIDSLPLDLWTLLSVYHGFLHQTVGWYGIKLFQPIEPDIKTRSIALQKVISVVLEVTFFSSLNVFKEFIELKESPTDFDSLPELNNWAQAFTARRIDRGDVTTGGEQDFDKILSSNECISLVDCSLSGRIQYGKKRWSEIFSHEIFAQNLPATMHATDHLLEFTGLLAAAQESENAFISKLRGSLINNNLFSCSQPLRTTPRCEQ
jgi:hypothetical protein